MLKNNFKKILTVFLIAFSPCYAQGNDTTESIREFDTTIIINTDASIDVTEKITAYADQDKIRHGIMRWLPTHYMDSYGITHKTYYQIHSILVNNKKTDYYTEKTNNDLKIYIGNRQTIIDPGLYTYTLQYHVNDAVNFLKDQDELYWNITGTSWDFPIYKATATIFLPETASILQSKGYTGKIGDKENNYSIVMPSKNQITFSTTKPLTPGQGLTVAVSWPKGIIQKPGTIANIKNQMQENRDAVIAMAIALMLLCYYLCVWYLYGRDPRKGTIIPLFEPPLNLSPAAIRFILQMGFDLKTLTAAIVGMATKGFITIVSKNKDITLTRISTDTSQLTANEKIIAEKLFAESPSIELSTDNRTVIDNTKNALKNSLASAYKNKLFLTNSIYLIPSLALSTLALIAAISSAPDKGMAFGIIFWLGFWTFGCYALLTTLMTDIRFSSLKKIITSTFFALPFFAGEIVGIYIFSNIISPIVMILLLSIVLLNILFYHLLKVPTAQGRTVMDQIEGFKLFLSTTERYRLNQLNPPEVTPQLFEKYLPYAIALDVEIKWAEQFNELLKLSEDTQSAYHPTWYSGTDWNNNVTSFASFLNGGITGALLTSSISSSSSASGGSGSSGGGRGGGGGGGW